MGAEEMAAPLFRIDVTGGLIGRVFGSAGTSSGE